MLNTMGRPQWSMALRIISISAVWYGRERSSIFTKSTPHSAVSYTHLDVYKRQGTYIVYSLNGGNLRTEEPPVYVEITEPTTIEAYAMKDDKTSGTVNASYTPVSYTHLMTKTYISTPVIPNW